MTQSIVNCQRPIALVSQQNFLLLGTTFSPAIANAVAGMFLNVGVMVLKDSESIASDKNYQVTLAPGFHQGKTGAGNVALPVAGSTPHALRWPVLVEYQEELSTDAQEQLALVQLKIKYLEYVEYTIQRYFVLNQKYPAFVEEDYLLPGAIADQNLLESLSEIAGKNTLSAANEINVYLGSSASQKLKFMFFWDRMCSLIDQAETEDELKFLVTELMETELFFGKLWNR